jgi:UDP-N-acetylmuramoyl-L-alanyl-D-glutamate--2,6-diaminopimelate ligase
MKELIYRVKRLWHYFKSGLFGGMVGQIKYHHPERKLKVIAITGTDGKTTTSTLTYSLLKTAGFKVGLISTVAAYIGDEELDTGFHVTSSSPADLYRFMNQMVEAGLEYLVLEVTSHGAYQYRTWGIRPIIAGLTNIDREHLDYHLNWQNYLEAKLLILKPSEVVVLNEDQDTYPTVKKALAGSKIITFGKEKRFGAATEKAVRNRFDDEFNRLNAFMAITIAKKLGVNEKDIVKGITDFKLPAGRMEFIPNKLDATLIVDFAHTPQALENALKSIRKNQARDKKMVAIFGCAGLRDTTKRAPMGKIGSGLADMAIFTAEDPRTENIWSIINQMKSDLGDNYDKVISIADRREAILYALQNYGDANHVIAIFGKGHEQSMCYGKTETLWNDITGVKEMLNNELARK